MMQQDVKCSRAAKADEIPESLLRARNKWNFKPLDKDGGAVRCDDRELFILMVKAAHMLARRKGWTIRTGWVKARGQEAAAYGIIVRIK